MQLPVRFGKYELSEYLGGGMSQVFRARDTVLNRVVAVKILSAKANADQDSRARFLEEARTACRVTHENIISVYDYGEEEKRPYMVMEFLTGESLRDAIKNNRTGDLQSQLRIALQISRALAFIHQQRIIHRDIKPENLFMLPNGRVKLMDFGIAKAEGSSLTRSGFILGTPYYMAPEQIQGKPLTPLVDIYSFGIVLFEILTGQKPISGGSVEQIFQQILTQPLKLDLLQEHQVPTAVVSLVQRTTSKNPLERVQTFDLIGSEIERLLEALDPQAPPAPVTTAPPATVKTATPTAETMPAWVAALPTSLQSPAKVGFAVMAFVFGTIMLLFFLIRVMIHFVRG